MGKPGANAKSGPKAPEKAAPGPGKLGPLAKARAAAAESEPAATRAVPTPSASPSPPNVSVPVKATRVKRMARSTPVAPPPPITIPTHAEAEPQPEPEAEPEVPVPAKRATRRPREVAAVEEEAPKKDADASGKKKKKMRRHVKAGLSIEVTTCETAIDARWKGHVANQVPVALAAMLEYIAETLISDAAAFASQGPDGQDTPITGPDVQAALTKNGWMGQTLIRGRVAGAAPITRKQPQAAEPAEQ